MPNDLAIPLKALCATVIDGTLDYPRFSEEQLVRLYNILSEQRDALAEAAAKDTGVTKVEAQLEVAEALKHVKGLAEQASEVASRLKDEKKAVLSGESKLERGKGVVVVFQSPTGPFYSVIAPLATAIVTSNAVVCLLSSSTSSVSLLLQTILRTTLDRFAYLFLIDKDSSSVISALQKKLSIVVVWESPTSVDADPAKAILSTSSGADGAIALVDRLEKPSSVSAIAHLLVRGKQHALGRLPGSVSRVFVHEDSSGALADAVLAECKSAYGKEDPKLLIDSFASHEEALVKFKQLNSTAIYVFSDDPLTGEYLAKESLVSTTYINDVPLSALYDPHRALTTRSHYTTLSSLIRAPLPSSSPCSSDPSSHLALLSASLPARLEWTRKPHSNTIRRVFFLQGVFISVGTVLTVLLGATVWGAWLAATYVRRKYFV
ncbi:hypothetical protein JCM8547_005545 [Rhodosporidiobolus lusitaniae]